MANDSNDSNNPVDRVDRQFRNALGQINSGNSGNSGNLPKIVPSTICPPETMEAIFRAQCVSRHLDRQARLMQSRGQGYYTIGSSGHEGMACVAGALRCDDMAFLHYRDGAFLVMRAMMKGDSDPLIDMLKSFACAQDDPISGGRHKVLGSKSLFVPPQTSTIASHLPKAVGAAFSIGLARKTQHEHQILNKESIVIASFGDASLNHASAQTAINCACWTDYQKSPMPILFVCEDNGIGISTKTPTGWVEQNLASRAGLAYFPANGCDLNACYDAAFTAQDYVRKTRKPATLHLRMVRLFGHAGSDVEAGYLDQKSIDQWEAHDPLLYSANALITQGALSADDVLAIYNAVGDDCAAKAELAKDWPRLSSAQQVMASIIPKPMLRNSKGRGQKDRSCDHAQMQNPQYMSRLLNWGLRDLLADTQELVLLGEDIGNKGGVYGVTRDLMKDFGKHRVIDSMLDEQSILGMAIGLGHNGFVPMPEIQFLAYLHNAEDQLRGEAATLSFFSDGQFSNPMVIRIAGLGYQKGFGGHFHNDNSLAVLRDIPGVIVACPSNGADGVLMLRSCVEAACNYGRVVVFLEPIALYGVRDLLAAGDGGWLRHYPNLGETIAIGTVGETGSGELAIITYGNCHYFAMRARDRLAALGIAAKIIDLRWISPLPTASLLGALDGAKAALVVDECRESGNVGEGVMAYMAANTDISLALLAAHNSFIATGPAYAATMPSVDDIIFESERLMARIAK